MVDASQVREHMEVVGSNGAHVGTVDHVDGQQIKLTKRDSADQHHHYIPLSSVARVDTKVHLSTSAAAALGTAGAAAGASAVGGNDPFPPVRNRAVEGARPRGNFWLPWIVGAVGVILLLLLLRSCFDGRDREAVPPPAATETATAGATTPLPVEEVTLPNGQTFSAEPNSLNYSLQRYLASTEPTPRTFQFDKLNFDTGSAAIRPEDQANVDALAQILQAYPRARVNIVGYTDARGSTPANANLGKERADAVSAALVAKGVEAGRITAGSGGETNPADTNATAQGQFENRRTELTVTAK